MYANIRHVFLLAEKPEYPLAILTGQTWNVVRTSVTAIAVGTAGLASDLLEITHYVEKVEPCPKPYPSCGRCHGAGVLSGWQGRCPQCGGKPLAPEVHEAPVRPCCAQRHLGVVCPDGKVMCDSCFNRVEVADLSVNSKGEKENVCLTCA